MLHSLYAITKDCYYCNIFFFPWCAVAKDQEAEVKKQMNKLINTIPDYEVKASDLKEATKNDTYVTAQWTISVTVAKVRSCCFYQAYC